MPRLANFWRSLKLCYALEVRTDDFTYVLLPFASIFKLFGFAPVKCVWRVSGDIGNTGVIDGNQPQRRANCHGIQWDLLAALWTAFGAIIYCVGFSCGVRYLSTTRNWTKLYEKSVVAYFTSWAQIMTLFALGGLASITSWMRLADIQRLFGFIFRIDEQLHDVADLVIDYRPLRRKLCLQLILSVVLPVLSSMVNCVVIERHDSSMTDWSASCFWFICFAPMLLLALKEFQFFSLMFILCTKCDLVNRKLRFLASASYRSCQLHAEEQERLKRMTSTSEMPLALTTPTTTTTTATSATVDSEDIPMAEKLNVLTLQRLFNAYSLIADAVELTLRIFAWHLLLITSTSIGVITIQSYNLFMLVAHSLDMAPQQVFFIVLWIFVQIIAVAVNVSACSRTATTMSRTGPLLHKIKVAANAEHNMEYYQMLQIFSLEVLHRKNNFTAAGFFDMNYKLITSIIAAVTTYLVIIIQFHLANIPDVHFNTAKPASV